MPASVISVTKGFMQGFVGNVSSEGLSLRSARIVNLTDSNSILVGDPVVLNANNSYSSVKQFIAGGGTFTAATPMAIAVAGVFTNLGFWPQAGAQPFPSPAAFYQPGQVCDALVLGTVNVQTNNGTPSGSGGTVYMRTALNGAIPAGVVGGFEAVADGGNTVALTNVKFKTGVVESDGTVQVTILTRTIA